MCDEKIYYLAFGNSSSYWFSRIFKDGFRHVHAIYLHDTDWYLVDPSLTCLHFLPLSKGRKMDFIRAYSEMYPELTFLKVGIKENKDMPVWRVGPISCVSTIQYMLGIYWPLTVSPWQLYCNLKSKTPAHVRIIQDGW